MAQALVNILSARPGQRDRVVEILIESGKLFDDNDACKLYLVAEAVDYPDTIWVIDRWASQDEHERALMQPELRPFVEESLPLPVGMPEQIEIRPSGRTTCSTE